MLDLEKVDWKLYQPAPVVGVDEVGRGCLAGPVVAAAVCLLSDVGIQGLTDSKLISEAQREKLAPIIHDSHAVAIGVASVEEIENLNILQASLLAMRRALEALEDKMGPAGHVLVDGTFRVPGICCEQTTLIKGDLRAAPISAASIVAKVYRDRFMRDLGERYPGYGFAKHKGYASPIHKKAIEQLGPTPWHRKTFKGVLEHLP